MSVDACPACWSKGLAFVPMTGEVAQHIADTWKYPAPYDFYDATADPEDYAEFVTPAQWPEQFSQVRHDGDLVGFFAAECIDDETCEISLGLRPDLTGAGRGLAFLRAGLRHIVSQSRPSRLTLNVAAFNRRAIRVYEEAGFTIVRTYAQETNGGVYEFVQMEREITSTVDHLRALV